MKTPYVNNIKKLTLQNTDYRREVFTAAHLQLVLMSLEPGQEIGSEIHAEIDQFFEILTGTGVSIIDEVEYQVENDIALVIPAGASHNIINTGSEVLKLYSIYAPPEHPKGTVEPVKEQHKIFTFSQFVNEGKKPAGAPDFHQSDAPSAEGRFRDLNPKDLAAWLIKTRKKDVKKISGSLTQQVVFNRKEDPAYADKMEKTRIEVYKQLGRNDLLERIDSEGNITCDSCNWSWTLANGGDDPFLCHNCGNVNII
jgi:mannose-6-phosphate isomerase-like protein (cupin superfamily)